MSEGVDFKTTTAKAMFEKFGIDDNTIAFTGHALALYRDDKYVPCMFIVFDSCTGWYPWLLRYMYWLFRVCFLSLFGASFIPYCYEYHKFN